jgi:hypothetical protein
MNGLGIPALRAPMAAQAHRARHDRVRRASVQLIADENYRGALAIAELGVPELGRLAVASVYALMKPYYARTTLLRMVADLIRLLWHFRAAPDLMR